VNENYTNEFQEEAQCQLRLFLKRETEVKIYPQINVQTFSGSLVAMATFKILFFATAL
jgi:hypothetical protein